MMPVEGRDGAVSVMDGTFTSPVALLNFVRDLEAAFDRAWPEYAGLKPAAASDMARAWPNA